MRWSAAEIGRGVAAGAAVGLGLRLGAELFGDSPIFAGVGSGGVRGLEASAPLRATIGACGVLLVLAAVALARGQRVVLAGWLATAAGTLAYELVTYGRGRLFAEPQLLLVALFGWSAGAWVGQRAAGPAAAADYGREGALGALGAAWGLAAVSKLRDGGLAWLDTGTIWHVVLASREVPLDAAGTPLATGSWLFDAVVASPALATAMAVASLAIELGAPLLAIRGSGRRVIAVTLAALHLGIDAIGGLGHIDLIVLVLLLGVPPDATLPTLERPRRLWPLVAVAWLVAVLVWALPVDRWLALPANRRGNAWSIAMPPGTDFEAPARSH